MRDPTIDAAGDNQQRHKPNLDSVKLTDREEDLANLILRGMNNREIADTLHIAEGTVRNYISSLYGKLEVVDRAQAIMRLQVLIGS